VLTAFFRCPRAKRLGFPVGQMGSGIDAYCAGEAVEKPLAQRAANDNTPRIGRVVY
jgi:hypothetical protein